MESKLNGGIVGEKEESIIRPKCTRNVLEFQRGKRVWCFGNTDHMAVVFEVTGFRSDHIEMVRDV